MDKSLEINTLGMNLVKILSENQLGGVLDVVSVSGLKYIIQFLLAPVNGK